MNANRRAGRSCVASHLPLSQSLHAVLMSNAWFASLPEAVRTDIVSCGRGRALQPGQRLFCRGDVSDGMYGVLEGTVRVSGVTREGRETVLDFYGPGSWFGEVSTLDGSPRIHDAEANGVVLLLQVSPVDLEELLAAHAAFSRALLRLEAQRLRILLTALESYSTQSLEQRLANRLLMLADHHGRTTTQGLELGLVLSQETLARLIGSTRQRVNQILKEFVREGIVEQHYGRIVLLDRARLETLARM